MTAEVALMNKHAVALAADSAVTITSQRGNKIYNAANKLFALSKWEPVGIMVYGNAEFMGVPWETIIKIYRRQLGERSFNHLDEYYRHFLEFLNASDSLFGELIQQNYVRDTALRSYRLVRDDIRDRVDAITKAGQELDDNAVGVLQSGVILEHLSNVSNAKFSRGMDKAHEDSLRALYAAIIDEALKAVFEKLPLSEGDDAALRDLIIFSLTRDKWPSNTAGIVVAGFGADEHFPALRSTIVQARIGGRLKYGDDSMVTITPSNGAAVVPFAQTDAVELFIEGIDPLHARYATRLVSVALKELADDILSSLELSDEDRMSASADWEKLTADHLRKFSDKAKETRKKTYIDPLVDVIATLPKDELAAVAEALVNITSLRRKVSMDAETVGGPIDVAVISKGDGLVWVRRKHYFDAALNPHFFTNYFRTREAGDGN